MKRLLPALALALQTGCAPEGCLTDAAECVVPSPCAELAFTCDGGSTELRLVESADDVPGGTTALGAPGDFVLANDHVVAVIEALDHPHYIAPTGGGIVDLSVRGRDNDSFRHLFQATGLLPEEAFAFTSVETFDEGDVKAIQFRGTLHGHPDVHVATRYEIRPCEPGIRVRSEIVNLGPDPLSSWLADAHYYGDRELMPFTPTRGQGFDYPSFGLTTVKDAFVDAPYLIAANHAAPAASYAAVACDAPSLQGFKSREITAFGGEHRILVPRDSMVFERFLGVSDGPTVSGAADVALEVRRQLWDEPYVTLTGVVEVDGDQAFVGGGLRAAVLVSEGAPDAAPEDRTPWTHTLPDADGTFAVRVPANRDYVVEVEAYGRTVAETALSVGGDDADVGAIALPAVGELTLDATLDGEQVDVLAFVLPADDATADAVSGRMFGQYEPCAPLLDSPLGGSPACNRVLVDGPVSFAIPPGTYDVFASVGPFSTLSAVRGVSVEPGTGQSVLLELTSLPVQPDGTLSGDFHVHGAASFDTMLPSLDRVRSFLASGVQVIAATDHDVVYDYAQEVEALDATDRMKLLVGVETTGHALFRYHPESTNPKVVGHWNFWPVPYDPEGPYRGAAWDEFAEPGLLFTRMRDAGWDADDGVLQLNHPWGGIQFGRDFGWATAMELDLTEPLPEADDGTAQGVFVRTPEGADFSNADYDVQEVMNGTSNATYLQYRAVWFYVLNQGLLRAGTANSDSHTLVDNVLGTPRNLVWADTAMDDFDPAAFNAGVREGRMLGTNGPVIEVFTTDADGGERTPSLTPFAPADDAVLHVSVSAAPWVPVEEVRIVVNGEVVDVLTDLDHPDDPLGSEGIHRGTFEIPLADLLPSGDAWLVVEAGDPLVDNADLDCNGIPDTGDTNGDGAIDWRDVDGLDADPGTDCLDTVGPLAEPAPETDRESPRYLFQAVVPDGYPTAFTNPLVFDPDGDGYEGVR